MLNQADAMHLFAYGTLMDPDIMARVCGISCRSRKATLAGFTRKRVSGEVYPAIVKKAGDSVEGIVYYNLPGAAFDRLDRFEGSLYVRTRVMIAVFGEDHPVPAESYLIRPVYAYRLSSEDWNLENFLRNDKHLFNR